MPSLYRDSDVEGMSDGWDDVSVYGFVHTLPLDDGHGPLRSLRYETRNSGLFYLSATHEALELTRILKERMASEAVWDQSAFNQETFRLAYGALAAAGVTVRVMNYLCVLNTKVQTDIVPVGHAMPCRSLYAQRCSATVVVLRRHRCFSSTCRTILRLPTLLPSDRQWHT